MGASIQSGSYIAHFLLECKLFQTKVVEKLETRILYSIIFFFSKMVPFMR